jgi:hypothetical protein
MVNHVLEAREGKIQAIGVLDKGFLFHILILSIAQPAYGHQSNLAAKLYSPGLSTVKGGVTLKSGGKPVYHSNG